MQVFFIKHKIQLIIAGLTLLLIALLFVNINRGLKLKNYQTNYQISQDSLAFFKLIEKGLIFLVNNQNKEADSLFEYAESNFTIDYDFASLKNIKNQDFNLEDYLNDSFLNSTEQMRKGLEHLSSKIKEQENNLSIQGSLVSSKSDSIALLQNSFDSLLSTQIWLKHDIEQNKKTIGKLIYTKDKLDIVYYGEIDNGKAQGQGMGVFSGKGVYVGQWENNFRHGKGKYTWANGDTYEGDFVNGVRSGYGVYIFISGEKYEGDWKNDVREGKGKFFSKEGKVLLDGDWIGDRFKKNSGGD